MDKRDCFLITVNLLLAITLVALVFNAPQNNSLPASKYDYNVYPENVREQNDIPIINLNERDEPVTITALHVDGRYLRDTYDNIVQLKGWAHYSMEDNADGFWYSSTIWSDNGVKAELDAIRATGANVIRNTFAINAWIDNTTDSASVISTRTALTRLASFCAERNMYLIICPVTVITGITNGIPAVNDPLPYPPYADSIGASSYISDEDDFVDFWSSVASVMKNYSNVLFEIWNEPQFGESAPAKAAWYTVAQNCITAIRAADADNVILVPTNDWGRAYCNIDGPSAYAINSQSFTGGDIGQIVHLYRNDHTTDNSGLIQSYADLDYALSIMGYYSTAASVPLVVTEVGSNRNTDVANEETFLTNALSLFNSHGISYTVWVWSLASPFRTLTTEAPSFTLNAAGEIASDAIGETPPPPPITGTITDTIGENTGNYAHPYNYWTGFPITASASGTLVSLGVYVIAAYGNIRLALYSTFGSGAMSGLLGQSASTAAEAGWNDLAISGSVAITEDTTYYICLQCDHADLVTAWTPNGLLKYKTPSTYGVFTDPTSDLSEDTDDNINLRMTYSYGVEPETPPTAIVSSIIRNMRRR